MLALTDHLARTTLHLQGYRSRTIGTSSGRIHLVEAEGHGRLPPLVLLHGLSSSGVHYLPLLQHLRPGVRRIVAPDMPAHGFSDRPADLSPSALKRALVEALDAAIDEPAVLFGNSLGGIAAIHYALTRPERVRALILCSPSGAPMTASELRRFVATFHIDSHADALGFVDRVLARPGMFRQAMALGVRARFADPAVQTLLASIRPEDLLRPEQLRELTMPLLLMWGRAERIFPREHLQFFKAHLPRHARLEEPEGFGHSPFLDDAPELARRILAFTAEVSTPGHRPHRTSWLLRTLGMPRAA